MKTYLPILLVVSAALLLYNVIPTEVTLILWLILIGLVINKWSSLKTNFS